MLEIDGGTLRFGGSGMAKWGFYPGQQERLHAAVPEQAPKRGGVERIAVQNEVLHAAEEAVTGVDQVPCNLRHQQFVRRASRFPRSLPRRS